MKKLLALTLAGIMAVSLAGCSQAPEEPGTKNTTDNTVENTVDTSAQKQATSTTGVTLEFLYNLNGEAVSDAVQEVCRKFTDETGIEVEAVMPGSNFSDIMKTRMASNQLPDVWTTHG